MSEQTLDLLQSENPTPKLQRVSEETASLMRLVERAKADKRFARKYSYWMANQQKPKKIERLFSILVEALGEDAVRDEVRGI